MSDHDETHRDNLLAEHEADCECTDCQAHWPEYFRSCDVCGKRRHLDNGTSYRDQGVFQCDDCSDAEVEYWSGYFGGKSGFDLSRHVRAFGPPPSLTTWDGGRPKTREELIADPALEALLFDEGVE